VGCSDLGMMPNSFIPTSSFYTALDHCGYGVPEVRLLANCLHESFQIVLKDGHETSGATNVLLDCTPTVFK
jgi:hypothetical protein